MSIASRSTRAVSAADYDNDGFVDFYVSNFNGTNFLYRNNHDNTFTETGRARLECPAPATVLRPGSSTTTTTDGWISSRRAISRRSTNRFAHTSISPTTRRRLKLYKNLGDGSFRDVTTEVGLDKVFMPMGANFGRHRQRRLSRYPSRHWKSVLRVAPSQCAPSQQGGEIVRGRHRILWHRRGCTRATVSPLPIWTMTATKRSSLKSAARHQETVIHCDCSRIPGHGNDWINLRLVGVKTNRAAIGARIKADR